MRKLDVMMMFKLKNKINTLHIITKKILNNYTFHTQITF